MKWGFQWPPKFGRDNVFYDYSREFLHLGLIWIEWVGNDWPEST